MRAIVKFDFDKHKEFPYMNSLMDCQAKIEEKNCIAMVIVINRNKLKEALEKDSAFKSSFKSSSSFESAYYGKLFTSMIFASEDKTKDENEIYAYGMELSGSLQDIDVEFKEDFPEFSEIDITKY